MRVPQTISGDEYLDEIFESLKSGRARASAPPIPDEAFEAAKKFYESFKEKESDEALLKLDVLNYMVGWRRGRYPGEADLEEEYAEAYKKLDEVWFRGGLEKEEYERLEDLMDTGSKRKLNPSEYALFSSLDAKRTMEIRRRNKNLAYSMGYREGNDAYRKSS